MADLARVGLISDNGDGDGDGGASQLATVSGGVSGGYTVRLAVGVDTGTAPAGGGTAPGGDGASGGAPPAGGGGTPPAGRPRRRRRAEPAR